MFILIVLIGLIPAFIAREKGRNFVGWWVYGSLLFIIALPHALCLKSGFKKCPFCHSGIPQLATVCKYCREKQPKVKEKGAGK